MQESGASAAQKVEDSTKIEDPPSRPASVSGSISVDEQLVAVDPAKQSGASAAQKAEDSTKIEDLPTRPISVLTASAWTSSLSLSIPPSRRSLGLRRQLTTRQTSVATLTASAVAEASQSAEHQDMLAASMRSLASSMNASLPVNTPQENKPRASTASDDVKPKGKPMARSVTDVSVADGSPLPPNTRFVKTWCMRNEGTVTFPTGCRQQQSAETQQAGREI